MDDALNEMHEIHEGLVLVSLNLKLPEIDVPGVLEKRKKRKGPEYIICQVIKIMQVAFCY